MTSLIKTILRTFAQIDVDDDDIDDDSMPSENSAGGSVPSPEPNTDAPFASSSSVENNQTPVDGQNSGVNDPLRQPDFHDPSFRLIGDDDPSQYHLIDPQNLTLDKSFIGDASQFYSASESVFSLGYSGPTLPSWDSIAAGTFTAALGASAAFVVGSLIGGPAAGWAAADAALEPAFGLGFHGAEGIEDLIDKSAAVNSLANMIDCNIENTMPMTTALPSPTPNASNDLQRSDFRMK
jgi:hypothetical protein